MASQETVLTSRPLTLPVALNFFVWTRHKSADERSFPNVGHLLSGQPGKVIPKILPHAESIPRVDHFQACPGFARLFAKK